MNEEHFRSLRRHTSWPETPDVTRAVRARISSHAHRPPRRSLAVAAATTFAALIVLVVVFPGADRVAAFFGIGGVSIEQGTLDPSEISELGSPIDPGLAAIALPDALGTPGATLRDVEGRVWAVYPPTADRPEVLLCVFPSMQPGGLTKLVEDPATQTEAVSVNGRPAYWVSGDAHFLLFQGTDGSIVEDRGRLSAPALIWAQGELTYRIESELSLAEAIEIAESVP